MDDRALRDLMMRVARLERESVRYRQGIVADDGPLDVQLGGSSVSYEGVRALQGATVDDDAVVGCLTFGNDLLVLGGVGSQLGIPFVTALPSPAFDGQVVDFDTGTDGVVWRLRYDAGSASSYKWQFIGGPGLQAATAVKGVPGSMTQIPATTYTTTLETVTAPLAGEYTVNTGGDITSQPGATNSYLGLHVAGTLDSAFEMVGSLTTTEAFFREDVKTLAANDALTLRTRVDALHANAKYGARHLRITPVRVG